MRAAAELGEGLERSRPPGKRPSQSSPRSIDFMASLEPRDLTRKPDVSRVPKVKLTRGGARSRHSRKLG